MGVQVAPFLSVIGVEALMIGTLALLFAAVWLRGRDAGLRTLSFGFALTCAWYLLSDGVPYSVPDMLTPAERASGIVIALAVLVLTVGVVQYLGWPAGAMRSFVLACWLPSALLIAAVAATPLVPHRLFHVGVLAAYVGPAVLAFRRAADEPGGGHVLLGVALLSLPATPLAMGALGVDPRLLKYAAGVSVAVFGMVLLTVSLLRRHRALEGEVRRRAALEETLRDANARLETRVGERTAHLHELIGGLEAFNRSVSHDLRGPLDGMSALARMAADALARGDSSLAHRALPLIAKQCDASVRMVSTMLDLARLVDVPVRREPVNLGELVRAAFDEVLLGLADGPRPALRCGELPEALADPRLLRPVLVNLLANAAKFSRGAAAPEIRVDAELRDGELRVSVRDNGIGFAPGAEARVFAPFVRAHGREIDGYGLGLSIVKRAVEAMGGTVSAASRPEGGAQLSFRLPDAAIGDRGPGGVAREVPEAATLGPLSPAP